jgi:hypothetical protein
VIRGHRAGARHGRAPATLVFLTGVLVGCGAADQPSPVEAGHLALQGALAEDYRTFLDENGLVHNPTNARREVLDVYGSAMLVGSMEDGSPRREAIDLSALGEAEVAAFVDATDIPREWLAASVGQLEAWSGQQGGADVRSEVPAGEGHEGRATALWLDVQQSPAVPEDPAEATRMAERATRLAAESDGGVVAAWRIMDSCRALQVSCPVARTPAVTVDLATPEGMMQARAAAELAAMGVAVDGWDQRSASEAGAQAAAALGGLPRGLDFEASQLARIVTLTGGSPDVFEAYLDREADRLDATTGLYRVHYEEYGTVANTYEAMMTVGDYFPEMMEGSPAVTTLRSLVSSGELDPVSSMQAYAVLDALGELEPADREAISDLADAVPWGLNGLGENLALVEALVQIGALPQDVALTPVPLSPEAEADITRLLAAAQDGALANGAEILAYYDEYLAGLPETVDNTPADDPAFLHRVSLYSNADADATARRLTGVASRLSSLQGCEDSTVMVRTSTSADSPCELRLTRLAVQSGYLGAGGAT